jgi:cellulose synthase (UDP-forming)
VLTLLIPSYKKVLERTSVPGQYLLWEYSLLAWLTFGAAWDFSRHHWMDGAFALSNAACPCYAIWAFIGWRNTLADMRLSVQSHIWEPLQAAVWKSDRG